MTVTCMLGAHDEADRAALAYGASLARRLETDLYGLCAMPDPSAALIYTTSPYMIGVGGNAVEGVQQAQTQLIGKIEAMFDTLLAEHGAGITSRFESIEEMPARAALRAAPLSEAVVFPSPAGCGKHTLSEAFERLMMDAKLPAVLAPAEFSETGCALLAWDASPQAARALRMALPLLPAMKKVIVAQNSSDLGQMAASPAASPESAAAYLEAKGLSAETHNFDGAIADGLIAAADAKGCEMIIAGAYGSSRAGEFLFGGATRGLLRAEGAPALFLVH